MADKKRMVHYDLLRIFAAFSVVMLHSAAQFWYTLDIHGTEWIIANSYDAIFRFGVPIFVMISGALFLSPNYQLDVKRLYKHNILRFLVIYIVWSGAYGLRDSIILGLGDDGWKTLVREVITGRYHLWFLPMLIGIYMLLPVLKSWVMHAEKENIRYFLLLFMFFRIGSETLKALTVTDELHYILDIMQIEMVCSYIGYFVLGYYLAHVGINARWRRIIFACALPAVLCNILLGNYLARRAGEPVGAIYDSFGIFTFIVVVAVFLFFQEVVGKLYFGEKANRLIGEVSANTLGVYVMHIGLMECLETVDIHSMVLPNVIGIPMHAIACFLLCMLAAGLLRRIPVIGKFLC